MPPRLAYIMSRFPHLPETFILREMIELERQGWDVQLYPLINQKETIVHGEAASWMSRAKRLPFYSPTVALENARQFARTPKSCLASSARVIVENIRDPKLLPRSILLLPKALTYARWMQREGVQHIHAHFATHPAMVAWLIHKITGISYSFTVHAHDIYVHKAMLVTKLRDASFIAAISEYNREYLARFAGDWVRQKTYIVHCGIEPEKYQARALPSPNPRTAPLRILSIGSLQPYKGQAYLVEACALLKARGLDVRCRIIGGGELGPSLAAQINRLGLQDVVILEGPKNQEEVASILPQNDCYIQPSIITSSGKMEGIPVSLMEAMACKLPCIATSISGVPELVQPDHTGILVPPADAPSLADAVEYMYHHPQDADSLAQAGYELVLKEFQLRENVKRLSTLFNHCTHRS